MYPEQLSQVEDVIVKKPNAIIFIPVGYKAIVPAVEKINAAGIPVTNITDRAAGGKFVAYVGANDYSIGLETARTLMKAMGGKGNVLILEGINGSLTSPIVCAASTTRSRRIRTSSCWPRSQPTISA